MAKQKAQPDDDEIYEQNPAAEPKARIVVEFYDETVTVNIHGFENLTPGKIQRSLDYILREWQTLQQRAIYEVRRRSK